MENTWGFPASIVVCEACDRRYLLPQAHAEQFQRCPHCCSDKLAPVDITAEQPYLRPAELLIPFSLPPERLSAAVQAFATGIPFAPADLNPASLAARLRPIYLPVWLLDARVQGTWQAQAGFDYQVVSHQDRFDENRGGWTSQQVNEGRIRWEPRLGRLERSYANVSAPALEEDARLRQLVGNFDYSPFIPYRGELVENAAMRLPDRTPQDAWSEAAAALKSLAASEVRQAASADHLKEFDWQPQFSNLNWTLLLLPLYCTVYLDDRQAARPVWINGQSGQLHGTRRASMRRARYATAIILMTALAIFLLSALAAAASLVMPLLLAVGGIGIFLSLLIAACALIPLIVVWNFNRRAVQ